MSPDNRNVADIYELAPVQREILDQVLRGRDEARQHVRQAVYQLGGLQDRAFEAAWRRLLQRHAVLRTSFHWEGLTRPVQVVHRDVALPLDRYDWRRLLQAEQQARLAAGLAADRERGLVLTEPPAVRLALVHLAGRSYYFIWTYHALILDKDSARRVLHEAFEIYRSELYGPPPSLPAVLPYRDYVAWIQQQGPERTESYWRQALAGFAAPTPLPDGHGLPEIASPGKPHRQFTARLSPELSTSITSLAERQLLSTETVLGAAWGLLLGRYAGTEDVVFGTHASGRPPGLDKGSVAVGHFARSVPVRVKLPAEEPVRAWLNGLQTRRDEARRYEHAAPAQIRAWSEIPAGLPLFETRFAVQPPRAPAPGGGDPGEGDPGEGDPGGAAESGVQAQLVRFESAKSRCPLSVTAVPADGGLRLKATYDVRRYHRADLLRLLRRFKGVLTYLTAHPEHRVGDVSLLKYSAEDLPLVEVQPLGGGAPLFFVHGAGGGVLNYVSLARWLGTDRPVILFQTRGQREEERPQHRIEGMAQHYLSALRVVQPEGPYLLGGWSMGGLVAFEMAQQLVRAGHEVAALALLDTSASQPEPTPADGDPTRVVTQFARQLGLTRGLRRLSQLPPQKQLAFVLRQAKAASLVLQETEFKQFQQQFRLYRAHLHAIDQYRPDPYPRPLTLVRAGDAVARGQGDPHLGWDRLAAAVDLRVVPGSHHSMLREPHVRELGRVLQSVLPHVRARFIR